MISSATEAHRESASSAFEFWRLLGSRGGVALLDCQLGTAWTYGELNAYVQQAAVNVLAGPRSLVLLFAENDLAGVACYLGALRAGHAVFLSPQAMHRPATLILVEKYRPEILLSRATDVDVPAGIREVYRKAQAWQGYQIWRRLRPAEPPLHEALALVLSTSASSGSPKCVRLSWGNLTHSAAQVAQALSIGENDRQLLSLPFSYVYGLSILNSGLLVGASSILGAGVLADQRSWRRIAAAKPTMIGAVSYTFECMRTLKLNAGLLPSLRKLTHSGDALDPELFRWLYEHFGQCGIDIYLMYGQTEASGRIAVLSPLTLPGKCRSVGRALNGSRIDVRGDGQIEYRGPGVMLGYANGREDLAFGDNQGGILATGDVGYLDQDGDLYITGRVSRYCKVLGQRISLDDIEMFVRRWHPAAAVVEKGGVVVVFIPADTLLSPGLQFQLAQQFRLPPHRFRIANVAGLPRTERGKIAYGDLHTLA